MQGETEDNCTHDTILVTSPLLSYAMVVTLVDGFLHSLERKVVSKLCVSLASNSVHFLHILLPSHAEDVLQLTKFHMSINVMMTSRQECRDM